MPILRGSGLGFFLGILPGAGAIIASFVSYAVEKRVSGFPQETCGRSRHVFARRSISEAAGTRA